MISQAEAVPLAGGASASWSTAYTYDGANRLATAAEGSAWLLSYGYDRFGNVSVADPNGVQYGGLSCPSYDATTNRCNGAGFGYDNGPGNLTTFPGSRTAVYDAENRQISLTDGGTTQYVYDGEGRRVQKVAGGQTTTYVYDATGQLAAEYGGATDPSGCTRCYLTVDHLGSTRLVTDAATGNVMRRYDYLPFGGEINSSWGQRSTVTGYVMSDGMEPKFTGKERDYESSLGLDYFGARYFSGAMGRWTSPDWSAKPQPVPYADLGDPETLNLYAYVRNNPLKAADRDGHEGGLCYFCGAGGTTLSPLDPNNPGAKMSAQEAQVWIGALELAAVAPTGGASLAAGAAGEALNAVTSGIAAAGLWVSGSSRVLGSLVGANSEQVSAGADAVGTLANPAGMTATVVSQGNLKAGQLATDISSVGSLAKKPSEAAKNPADAALTVKGAVESVKDAYRAGKALVTSTPQPSRPKPPSPPACALQPGGC